MIGVVLMSAAVESLVVLRDGVELAGQVGLPRIV